MRKVISFYLPQFHPIPENDEWWGRGFTEWRNVAAARPRFVDHHQPHIPADMGFYDLRVAETRSEQAQLAESYGVDGFCYYHYWFNGQRLLERPLREVLEAGEPNFPFCLCWANENWTRAWDGLEREILLRQEYSDADSDTHVSVLLEYFLDERYIKIDNKPLFIVYRPDSIPNPRKYFSSWRAKVQEAGLPGLYICAVKSGLVGLSEPALLDLGYDAILDFQPNRDHFPSATSASHFAVNLARKILPQSIYQALKGRASVVQKIDYSEIVTMMSKRDWPQEYKRFPCVFPSWDNTARRKTPTVIQNLDPAEYKRWLGDAFERVSAYPNDEQLIFVNAWNEWAEGCHLEPDTRLGRAFLTATKEVVEQYKY